MMMINMVRFSVFQVVALIVIGAPLFAVSWGFVVPAVRTVHPPRNVLLSKHLSTLRQPRNRNHERYHRNAAVLSLHSQETPQFAAPDKQDIKSLISAAAFCAVDVAFRRLFQKFQITFPSSLGACGCLFALLLALKDDNFLYQQLKPGATLLAKWLPVFFVPSLVTLPLTDSIGTASEIFKVGSVVVVGFLFTLLTTAYSVVAVRKFTGDKKNDSSVETAVETVSDAVVEAAVPEPKQKAFSDELFNFLSLLTVTSGIGALLPGASSAPVTSLFLLSTTLTTFCFGARLPKKFTKVVHPLVTCTVLTWTAMGTLSVLTRRSFRSILKSYTTSGGLRGIHSGAGNVLLFLLGPAVVSLAISMYERRKLMKENLAAVGTAIGVSTIGGLFGTAFSVRLLEITSPYLRLSLLSRNITSPLAMAIASILGADISLAVSMVVVTGLIGANFGASILDAVGIRDAVARGLGIGAAAHGLGTAAFANEKDAFPFAAIAMALTATAATVTVSIPILRRILFQLALG